MKSSPPKPPQPRDGLTVSPPAASSFSPDGANRAVAAGTAFGCQRDFLDNRFVYTVISPRARGLSVSVNMNPDQRCNFDCVYCEVNRSVPPRASRLDVPVMISELDRTLALIHTGGLQQRRPYRGTPAELLTLRHVALSGDGEPTLCADFAKAIEAVIHFRTRARYPFFKLVLLTNGSGLDRAEVTEGLRWLAPGDEVWAKLDAGTQLHMDRVNRPDCSLERIRANILSLARRRPVVIQSLFPSVGGQAPPRAEIEAYVQALAELKAAGAQISLVQIYSATPHSQCGHLRLEILSEIAQRVRAGSGLRAEVF